ncbi:hypothetical protein FHG87_011143 [Trinorchestia longiramus]|nr:hypothetical protein FHG87_011143 [Trinorchestia longiramus]
MRLAHKGFVREASHYVSIKASRRSSLHDPIFQHNETRLEFRYERKFYVDQSENKATKVNTVMRSSPVTTGNTILTNERSRSGSRSQITAQYKEAVTLCVMGLATSEGRGRPSLLLL